MYFQLTEAVKRRILNEVKRCFSEYFPKHDDIIDFVQTKYAFDSRPQKGVIVSITGTNPEWLAADNFQGTVISHAMLSKVGGYPGHSIEWVKEDRLAIEREGRFPSPPGIYYIDLFSKENLEDTLTSSEFQNMIDQEGDYSHYFYVDPLLSKKNEPIAEATDSDDLENKSVFLTQSEFTEGSLRLFTDNYQLTSAPRLILEADKSIEVISDEELGLPIGPVRVEAEGDNQETFDITSDENDQFNFVLNGRTIQVQLDPGFRLADEIANEIEEEIKSSGVPHKVYEVFARDGRLVIQAQKSLEFLSSSQSTANSTLGFSEGFASSRLEGDLFIPHIESDTETRIEVNGDEYSISLYEGDTEVEDIVTEIEDTTNGTLSVSSEMGGDYVAYPDKGEIELLKPFSSGTRIRASYKYPSESRGPFGIDEKRSTNEAIPGVVLAFGSRILDRDKQAVVVHDERKDVALEYGGRWNMDVNLDLISRSHQTRGEITDALMMYFTSLRRSSLSEEGIEITDVSSGGESEETYQDSEGQIYYLNSISLSMRTDWAVHVAKPLVIERVRPVTREGYDLEVAGKSDEEAYDEDSSDVQATQDISLEEARDIYFVGKTKDFERIK